jgi:fructokinase
VIQSKNAQNTEGVLFYEFNKKKMSKPTIVCFGEVLWDMLPTGKLAGGAPMNVAYHLNHLGAYSRLVSRVGNDALGVELTNFLTEKGVSTDFVQMDNVLATGIVDVTLDEKGSPSYKIIQPVAWDNISITSEIKEAVSEADAFVFGSLICRNAASKQTFLELLDLSKRAIFDVNLREPFYSKDTIQPLLEKANIVKMNEEELAIISQWYGVEMDFLQQIKDLQQRFDIATLIVSHGSKGAYCFENEVLHFEKALEIVVKDTIGSGDAFLAGFLSEKLNDKSPQECLKKACALGAYVATKAGATPPMALNL